jgi:hypothetical protein
MAGLRLRFKIFVLPCPLGALRLASQSAEHESEELRRLNLSLIEAIIAAEKEGGGKATSAEFQFKRGNPAFLRSRC